MSGYNFSAELQPFQYFNRRYLILLWIFAGLLGVHNWQLHQSLHLQKQYLSQLQNTRLPQHDLHHRTIQWAGRLKKVALALPEQMYFERLDCKQSLIRLQGKTQKAKFLKNYQRALRHLNGVKHVRLEQLKAPVGSSLQSFIITVSFK